MNLTDQQLADFRTQICAQHKKGNCANPDRCPDSHCQTWQRRNPYHYNYASKMCPDIEFVKKGNKMTLLGRCTRGRVCTFAHSKEEELYHPSMYKTRMCNAHPYCTRYFCPFAHHLSEIREPSALLHYSDPPQTTDLLHELLLANSRELNDTQQESYKKTSKLKIRSFLESPTSSSTTASSCLIFSNALANKKDTRSLGALSRYSELVVEEFEKQSREANPVVLSSENLSNKSLRLNESMDARYVNQAFRKSSTPSDQIKNLFLKYGNNLNLFTEPFSSPRDQLNESSLSEFSFLYENNSSGSAELSLAPHTSDNTSEPQYQPPAHKLSASHQNVSKFTSSITTSTIYSTSPPKYILRPEDGVSPWASTRADGVQTSDPNSKFRDVRLDSIHTDTHTIMPSDTMNDVTDLKDFVTQNMLSDSRNYHEFWDPFGPLTIKTLPDEKITHLGNENESDNNREKKSCTPETILPPDAKSSLQNIETDLQMTRTNISFDEKIRELDALGDYFVNVEQHINRLRSKPQLEKTLPLSVGIDISPNKWQTTGTSVHNFNLTQRTDLDCSVSESLFSDKDSRTKSPCLFQDAQRRSIDMFSYIGTHDIRPDKSVEWQDIDSGETSQIPSLRALAALLTQSLTQSTEYGSEHARFYDLLNFREPANVMQEAPPIEHQFNNKIDEENNSSSNSTHLTKDFLDSASETSLFDCRNSSSKQSYRSSDSLLFTHSIGWTKSDINQNLSFPSVSHNVKESSSGSCCEFQPFCHPESSYFLPHYLLDDNIPSIKPIALYNKLIND